MTQPSAQDVERLAARIAADLLNSDPPVLRGPVASVIAAITKTIADNLATEAAIDREAARALEAMGADAAGLDRHKLLRGLRERLAQKRGFVL